MSSDALGWVSPCRCRPKSYGSIAAAKQHAPRLRYAAGGCQITPDAFAAWAAGGNRTDDVTDCGRRGLRSASGAASSHQPSALPQRLLARPGDDARHDRPRVAVLSAAFADFRAARLAARRGQAGRKPSRSHHPGARPVRHGDRDLQSALRLADGVQRGHGGRLLPRAQRLAGQGVAPESRTTPNATCGTWPSAARTGWSSAASAAARSPAGFTRSCSRASSAARTPRRTSKTCSCASQRRPRRRLRASRRGRGRPRGRSHRRGTPVDAPVGHGVTGRVQLGSR